MFCLRAGQSHGCPERGLEALESTHGNHFHVTDQVWSFYKIILKMLGERLKNRYIPFSYKLA